MTPCKFEHLFDLWNSLLCPHFAASKIVNGIEWTSALESVFEGNRYEDPSLSWQYFGSDEGFMRTYPGMNFHWNTKLS